eukprot:Colp12_sorted_trinity150504_noHs@18963
MSLLSQFQRLSISAPEYLEDTFVKFYIQDAVCQLLSHKEDNSKEKAIEFLAEYFNSVRNGTHVLFREYVFIRATPRNRAAYISHFQNSFPALREENEPLLSLDFHNLAVIFCPDFPQDVVNQAFNLLPPTLVSEEGLASFNDFLAVFRFHFYFEEFSNHLSRLYSTRYTPNTPANRELLLANLTQFSATPWAVSPPVGLVTSLVEGAGAGEAITLQDIAFALGSADSLWGPILAKAAAGGMNRTGSDTNEQNVERRKSKRAAK